MCELWGCMKSACCFLCQGKWAEPSSPDEGKGKRCVAPKELAQVFCFFFLLVCVCVCVGLGLLCLLWLVGWFLVFWRKSSGCRLVFFGGVGVSW